jgi:hypothetical protein
LQEVAALFLEENLVHAEHFVSELVYIKWYFSEVQYTEHRCARGQY